MPDKRLTKAETSFEAKFGGYLIDDGVVGIPRTMLRNYMRLGLSAEEFLFVTHLLDYKWDGRAPFPKLENIAMPVSLQTKRKYVRNLRNRGLLFTSRVYWEEADLERYEWLTQEDVGKMRSQAYHLDCLLHNFMRLDEWLKSGRNPADFRIEIPLKTVQEFLSGEYHDTPKHIAQAIEEQTQNAALLQPVLLQNTTISFSNSRKANSRKANSRFSTIRKPKRQEEESSLEEESLVEEEPEREEKAADAASPALPATENRELSKNHEPSDNHEPSTKLPSSSHDPPPGGEARPRKRRRRADPLRLDLERAAEQKQAEMRARGIEAEEVADPLAGWSVNGDDVREVLLEFIALSGLRPATQKKRQGWEAGARECLNVYDGDLGRTLAAMRTFFAARADDSGDKFKFDVYSPHSIVNALAVIRDNGYSRQKGARDVPGSEYAGLFTA